MKQRILVLVSIVLLAGSLNSCKKAFNNDPEVTLEVINDRLTFWGFTVTIDYEVVGTKADGSEIKASQSLPSGGGRGVLLSDEKLEKGSTLQLFAEGYLIWEGTIDEGKHLTYHDTPYDDYMDGE